MYLPICAESLAKSPDVFFIGFSKEPFIVSDDTKWLRRKIDEHVPNVEEFGTPHSFLSDLRDRLMTYGIESKVEEYKDSEKIVTSLVFSSPHYVRDSDTYALRNEGEEWFLYKLMKERH